MPDFEDILQQLKKQSAQDEIRKGRKAVALDFDKARDPAPKIIASGKGVIAENIIEIAKQHNIPIHEDKNLVEILSSLELDSFIPLEAYVTVAQILAFIYKNNAESRR